MRYFAYLIITLLFISCGDEDQTNLEEFSYLPDAVGGYSTINIIADQNLWEEGLQRITFPVFEREIEGLYNPEAEFDVKKVRSKAFNRLFKRQRFLLIFVVSGKVKTPGISFKNDVYANGQVIVQVAAKTKGSVIELFKAKKEEVFNILYNHRTKVIQRLAKSENNSELESAIQKNLRIGLTIPKSYTLAKDTTNFFYAVKKSFMKCEKFDHSKCYIQSGILSYTFDYKGPETFNAENFIAIRDSITQLYLEGKTSNDTLRSYMEVEKGFPVTTNNISLNGKFGFEMKGWWNLKNGTMAGPFVTVATVDEKRNKVIVADAYIYGPNFNKRRFIKELESVCKTVKPLK